jgi:methyl-accepting chemotaxis protein
MLGDVLIFIAGIVCMGTGMLPVLGSYKKRISKLEAQCSGSAQGAAEFREKTIQFAAAVKESAEGVSFSGPGSLNLKGDHAAGMEKIEGIITENSRIAGEIADKTGSVSAIASKMEEDVLHGFVVLEKNVKKMEVIKDKNSEIINGIISLGNKVNKIRDIVRTINTITDQTKVIAFNAALEAASAGETGKRFAVVSGEVNRLAEDIAVLTREIREQIEEIQTSSSSLIVSSEEGSDRIAEGHKLIKDLEDIFKEIRSSAEITSHQTQTITISTQQQLKSSEQISTAVADFSRRMKHFIGTAEKIALSTGALTERTHELERFLTEGDGAGQDRHGDR